MIVIVYKQGLIFSRVATKSNSAYNMMNVVRASTFSFPHNILRMKCLI